MHAEITNFDKCNRIVTTGEIAAAQMRNGSPNLSNLTDMSPFPNTFKTRPMHPTIWNNVIFQSYISFVGLQLQHLRHTFIIICSTNTFLKTALIYYFKQSMYETSSVYDGAMFLRCLIRLLKKKLWKSVFQVDSQAKESREMLANYIVNCSPVQGASDFLSFSFILTESLTATSSQ